MESDSVSSSKPTLFNVMEKFILNEIDYAQQCGYSSRAKRYMKRKLNEELKPYLEIQKIQEEDEGDKDSEYEKTYELTEMQLNKRFARNYENLFMDYKLNIFYSFVYISVIFTFYVTIMYLAVSSKNYVLENEKKSC